MPALLILTGGDTRWVEAWVYVILSIVSVIISRVLMAKKHPDLIAERGNYAEKSDTKPWDRILAPLVALWLPLVYFVIAGLDHRFSWTKVPIPGWIITVSWVVMVTGFALATWALVENRFFAAVARIQKDRGQTVVDTGPYRIVRHPGYAGSVLVSLMFPLVLGTLWAYPPVLAALTALVLRTWKEDKMLQEELPGYPEYTRTTRFRLLPGLW